VRTLAGGILDRQRNGLYNISVGEEHQQKTRKILTYDDFVNYLSRYDKDGAALAKLNKMVSEKGLPED
jgi:hypothetical protein